MADQELKFKISADANQARLTVAELRAQLGSDFDKVIAQAKVGNAAIVENLTAAATTAKQALRDEAVASASIFKTIEAGRQEYVASTIKSSETAASSIVSNYVKAGASAKKEVDALEEGVKANAARLASIHADVEKAAISLEQAGTRMAGSFQKAEAAIQSSGQSIAAARQQAGSLISEANSLASSLTPVAIGLGVVAVAAAAAGIAIFEMVKRTSDETAHLEDLSQRTNYAVETMSTLKNTAELTGGSIDTISISLAIFNKNLGAADDGAKKQRKTLEELNVAGTNQEQVLRQTFKALYDLSGSYKQNEYAQQLFGKASRDVLAVIKETHGDLDKATEKYRELGTLVGTDEAQAAKQFRTELVLLEQQVEALTRGLVEELRPGLEKTFARAADLIQSNKQAGKEWGGIIVEMNDLLNSFMVSWYKLGFRVADVGAELVGLKGTLLEIKSIKEWFDGHTPAAGTAGGLAGGAAAAAANGLPAGVNPQFVYKPTISDETLQGLQTRALKQSFDQQQAEAQRRQEEAQKQAEAASKRASEEYRRYIEAQQRNLESLNRTLAQAILQNENFGKSEIDAAVATMRANSGIEKLTGQYRAAGEQALKSIEIQMRDLDAKEKKKQADEDAKKKQDDYNQAVFDFANKIAPRQLTAMDEVKIFLARNAGYVDDYTKKWLELNAQMKDNEELTKNLIKSGALTPPEIQIPKSALSQPGPGYGKPGPWVDPSKITEKAPEGIVTDPFAEWSRKASDAFGLVGKDAKVMGDMVTGVFSQMAQGVGQMVQSFVEFGNTGGSFRKFAAEIVASLAAAAAVQAVYEVAQGLAWLALNFFFPDPSYIKAATTAFTSAAVFGSIAGVAAIAGRGIAGNSFAQNSAGAASGGGTSGGSSSSPTPSQYAPFNYNNTATPSGVGNSGVGGVLQKIHAQLSRVESMPPGDVLVLGAGTTSGQRAIGNATLAHSASSPGFRRTILSHMGFDR